MERINTPEEMFASAAFERTYYDAKIPVMEKVVRFRSLNAKEHEELKHLQAKKPKLAVAIAISSTVCNSDGDLIFTPESAERLASMHSVASDAMLDIIAAKCVNTKSVEEMIADAAGNSESGEAE